MSFMLRLSTVIAMLLLAFQASCVTSGGQPMSFGGGGSSDPVVMKVNGQAIKADEMIKSPVFRQSLFQFAYIQVLKANAAKAGIKPDTAAVDKQLADQKEQMSKMGGMKWEDMLRQQSMTETDVREMMTLSDLHKQLTKKLAGDVPEADLKAAWDKQHDELVNAYSAQNYLTEAQKKALKFEDVKEYIRTQKAEERERGQAVKMQQDLMRDVKVELPALDAKEQQQYIDLIFKSKIQDDKDKPGAAVNGGKPPVTGGQAPPPPAKPGEQPAPPPATPPATPPAAPPATPPAAPPAGGGK